MELKKSRSKATVLYNKVQLGLNLRVARELGITVPQPLILRADQVIR